MWAGIPPSYAGPNFTMSLSSIFTAVLTLSVLATKVIAHEHHGDEIPEGAAVSADPIVSSRPRS